MLTAAAAAAAIERGQFVTSGFRKAPNVTTAAGIWVDLSMSPGNPPPNYYAAAPLAAVPMARSTHVGLDHGADPPGVRKYLHSVTLSVATATAVPCRLQLLDYLLFYPFVEQDGAQAMVNASPLPRYPDGVGVRIMPVLVASQAGGSTFRVRYTNSDGVADRLTPIVTCNTQAVNGTLIGSAPATDGACGPFVPLQDADRGVRQIDEVEFLTPDVGLVTFVLVKSLASFMLNEITAVGDVDFLRDRNHLPAIEPDAYLNLLCCPRGTIASSAFFGHFTTMWV